MKSLDHKTAQVIQDLFITKKIPADQASKLILDLTQDKLKGLSSDGKEMFLEDLFDFIKTY